MPSTKYSARARRRTNAEIAQQRRCRPRLDVLAETPAEVICAAGGWMTDQALAGWDIHVFVAAPHDIRPLTILGVTAHHLTPAPLWTHIAGHSVAVATSAEILSNHHDVLDDLESLLRSGRGVVTVWGQPDPTWPQSRLRAVTHTPSRAATMFKRCALRAALCDETTPDAVLREFHEAPIITRSDDAGDPPRLLLSEPTPGGFPESRRVY